jgi:hypothetical protein
MIFSFSPDRASSGLPRPRAALVDLYLQAGDCVHVSVAHDLSR